MYQSNLLCVMFTLDAEFRSERCHFKDKKKTKSEIKKELEDSIANGKKNENTDIEEMANNCDESEEDAAKVIHGFEEIIKNKKVTQYGQLTTKAKYFRNLNLKNDLLMIWLQNVK